MTQKDINKGKPANISSGPLGKGGRKTIEKVEYKGDFRIVGTVWSGPTEVGYAVIDVKTYVLKLFTKVQTVELLRRFKFENAKLEGDRVENTECSMTRLLKFDTNSRVIGNWGITILGEISISGKILGYRAMDADGKVTDIKESELVEVSRRFVGGIINAKIVPTGGKEIVSAIKGGFKRIEKIPASMEAEASEATGTVEERHKKYLDRALNNFKIKVAHGGGIRLDGKEPKKQARIVMKEYVLPTHPEFKSCNDCRVEDILTAAITILIAKSNPEGYLPDFTRRHWMANDRKPDNYVPKANNVLVYKFSGYMKFPALDPKVLKTVKRICGVGDEYNYLALRNDVIEGKVSKIKTEENPIKHETLRLSLNAFKNELKASKSKEERKADRVMYDTTDFDYRDETGLAVFGYTVDKSQVGRSHNSPVYGQIPLRWVFDVMDITPEQEKFLLDNIQCYGDVHLVQWVTEKYVSGTRAEQKWAECLLFLLAIHNPVLAKFVVEYGFTQPPYDIDAVSRENFFLTSEDELYYLSGGRFNRHINLIRGRSWGDLELNRMPGATYEAMCMYLGSSETNELPFSLSLAQYMYRS